jgi:transcriptional regulator with XRE-family HTH domain
MDRTEFGNRVRVARTRRGLTQSQLGERLGVKRSAVSGWEKGRSTPPQDRLYEMADALGITADWLLGRQGRIEDALDPGLFPGATAVRRPEVSIEVLVDGRPVVTLPAVGGEVSVRIRPLG